MAWITDTSQRISQVTLLSIKNDIHLSLSRGEATTLVILDLSAAFDTIDHSTVLSCLLDWFSVGNSILKWFSSYRTEDFQSVKIGSTLSNLQKMLFGMPQGPVLGSMLFSLYTRPLSTLIEKHKGIKFHFYADNKQVYVYLSHILGTPFTPPSQSGIWVCGLTLSFPSLNMSRMFVNSALFN